jgi:hypothetical protein
MNEAIRSMLTKPGLHCVPSDGGLLVVEVEPDGTCHQCNARTGERDGILRPERWNPLSCEVWPRDDQMPAWFAVRKAAIKASLTPR